MIVNRLSTILLGAASAALLTSCGMFGSSSESSTPAYTGGGQEYDPYSNSWRPARTVAVPTSQPNAYLAQKAEEQKKENSIVKKTSRAVSNATTATAEAVKKPLKWVPFVGGKEKSQEEVDPNYYPAPAPGQ